MKVRQWFLSSLDQNPRFVFAQSARTRIHAITLDDDTELILVDGGPTAFLPDGFVSPGGFAVLHVYYSGEPPLLSEVLIDETYVGDALVGAPLVFPMERLGADALIDDDSKALARGVWGLIADALVSFSTPVRAWSEVSQQPEAVRLRHAFRLRQESEEQERRARRFFHKLDRMTMLDRAIPRYEDLYAAMGHRLDVRLHSAGRPEFDPLTPEEVELAQVASDALNTLILTELGGDVSSAFELFAGEMLSTNHGSLASDDALLSHGVPNGEDFFLFAEFAFACVDVGIDSFLWESRLEHFVRASHVYAEQGQSQGVDANLEEGAMSQPPIRLNFERNRLPYPVSRLAELRTEYRERSTEWLRDRFSLLVRYCGNKLEGKQISEGDAFRVYRHGRKYSSVMLRELRGQLLQL